jgi:hypothetical protein
MVEEINPILMHLNTYGFWADSEIVMGLPTFWEIMFWMVG